MNTVVILADILVLFLHQRGDVCDLSCVMLILVIVMMSKFCDLEKKPSDVHSRKNPKKEGVSIEAGR